MTQEYKKTQPAREDATPKKTKSMDMTTKPQTKNTKQSVEQSSSSNTEKNSILEFEMLEKECFVQEQDPSHVATEQSHLE